MEAAKRNAGETALTFTPKWETISEALQRMIVFGTPKPEAKRNLCRAIADRVIEVRQILAADPSRGLDQRTLSSNELSIQPLLSPMDIDWKTSCTKQVWPNVSRQLGEPVTLFIQRNHELLDRTVECVQVSHADMTQLFCNPKKPADAKPLAGPPKQRPVKRDVVKQVIKELSPDETNLPPQDLKRLIIEQLKARGVSTVSARTIERAFEDLSH